MPKKKFAFSVNSTLLHATWREHLISGEFFSIKRRKKEKFLQLCKEQFPVFNKKNQQFVLFVFFSKWIQQLNNFFTTAISTWKQNNQQIQSISVPTQKHRFRKKFEGGKRERKKILRNLKFGATHSADHVVYNTSIVVTSAAISRELTFPDRQTVSV